MYKHVQTKLFNLKSLQNILIKYKHETLFNPQTKADCGKTNKPSIIITSHQSVKLTKISY